ncbi:TIGR02269 family lipoprotein [Stigmatella aurantiaca]|uniref:SitA6 family polymorphic toxin lipoprotein n=1 Tax=Stigmatella aurantiaca TaxID=41 RepID=UPI00094B1497|nr:TIGR02269 family lipoprotein [Stigmatella aurantiaca]
MNFLIRALALGALLSACVSVDVPRGYAKESEEISWEKGCQDARVLEVLCAQDSCAFVRCRDLLSSNDGTSGKVEPARWNRLLRRPGWQRGRAGFPQAGVEPVFVIRWNHHPAPVLPSPRVLTSARMEKHHIFPQEPRLARWFGQQGINIHEYTLLIPLAVHRRIHGGRGGRGGLWNEEWRRFIEARQQATPEDIWRHAIHLIVQYDLTGASMGPYR